MKIKLFSVLPILLVLSFGCSPVRVNYDYDADADFSSLKRYDWLESSPVIQEEELSEKRIKKAITMNLRSKGFVHSGAI